MMSLPWALDEADAAMWNLAEVAEHHGDLAAALEARYILGRLTALRHDRRNHATRPFLSAADRREGVAASEVSTT